MAASLKGPPLEKEIQAKILQYLAHRRNIVFWRQNSGSFTAVAVRAVAGVISKLGLSPIKKSSIMASVKRAVGHYKCTSEPGLPDITVLYRGIYMGLEVKKHNGKQTKEQIRMEAKMKKVGAHYFIVRNIEDVQAAFAVIDKKFVIKLKE